MHASSWRRGALREREVRGVDEQLTGSPEAGRTLLWMRVRHMGAIRAQQAKVLQKRGLHHRSTSFLSTACTCASRRKKM